MRENLQAMFWNTDQDSVYQPTIENHGFHGLHGFHGKRKSQITQIVITDCTDFTDFTDVVRLCFHPHYALYWITDDTDRLSPDLYVSLCSPCPLCLNYYTQNPRRNRKEERKITDDTDYTDGITDCTDFTDITDVVRLCFHPHFALRITYIIIILFI